MTTMTQCVLVGMGPYRQSTKCDAGDRNYKYKYSMMLRNICFTENDLCLLVALVVATCHMLCVMLSYIYIIIFC